MALKFKRVKKDGISQYFGNDGAAVRAFWDIAQHAGYKRLLSLIQRVEGRGYGREDALYLINSNGARFVEGALKFRGVDLELAIEAVQKVGSKKVKQALELAKKRKRKPEQVLRRYLATAERLSTDEIFQRNEAIKHWMKGKGFSQKQIQDFFRVGNPFMNSFEPKKVDGYRIELDIRYMQGLDMAPVTMSLTKGTAFGTVGFMSLFFSEEAGQKIISIHDVQTDPLHKGEGIDSKILRDWVNMVYTEIKEHAKKQGFKKIRILRPEHHPLITRAKEPERIKGFYYTIAKRLGLNNRTRFYMEGTI